MANAFVTRRHVHRAVPQAKAPGPISTGINYLEMVHAAEQEAAGTGEKIDFSQLAMFGEDLDSKDTGSDGSDTTEAM